MRKLMIPTMAALLGTLLLSQSAAAQHNAEGHGQHQGAGGGHGEHAGAHGAGSGHSAAATGASFGADMQLVHQLLVSNESIRRTVTDLSNGVQTVTESDDPRIAAAIKAHVLSMDERLVTGDIFNVLGSTRIPEIFENAERIQTTIEETDTGVVFIQTSDDPRLVPVLQGHAREVDELVASGMAAMHGGGGRRMHQGANHEGAGQ